jgi:hypothetical protein
MGNCNVTAICDGWEDPGKYAERTEEKELETYEGVIGMRQSTVNLGTAMLWHLLEQQMLFFHMRQVLNIPEEREVRKTTPKTKKKLFSLWSSMNGSILVAARWRVYHHGCR